METTFHRYKAILGSAMRARGLASQRVEVRLGCKILNTMTALGIPDGEHRAVIVRMRYHSPPLNDVERRTAEGRPKREIIRCLKRFLAREIFQRVMADYRARQAADLAA